MRSSILIAGLLACSLAQAVTIDFQVLGNTASFQVQGNQLQRISGTAVVDLATGDLIDEYTVISSSSLTRDWSVSGTFDLTPTALPAGSDVARQYSLLSNSTTGIFDLLGGTPLNLLPQLRTTVMDLMTPGGAYSFMTYDLGATEECGAELNTRMPGCEVSELTLILYSSYSFDSGSSLDRLFPNLNRFLLQVGNSWITPLDANTATLHIDVLTASEIPEPGSIALCAAGVLGLVALRRRRPLTR